jgi:hypothetical protein
MAESYHHELEYKQNAFALDPNLIPELYYDDVERSEEAQQAHVALTRYAIDEQIRILTPSPKDKETLAKLLIFDRELRKRQGK